MHLRNLNCNNKCHRIYQSCCPIKIKDDYLSSITTRRQKLNYPISDWQTFIRLNLMEQSFYCTCLGIFFFLLRCFWSLNVKYKYFYSINVNKKQKKMLGLLIVGACKNFEETIKKKLTPLRLVVVHCCYVLMMPFLQWIFFFFDDLHNWNYNPYCQRIFWILLVFLLYLFF